MGALDAVLNEAGSRFGLSSSKVTTLLSSLLSFMNEQGGGLSGLLDRFRSTGMGDIVSSWLGGGAPTASATQVETALGRDTLSNMASKAGVSMSTAASALAFMIPRIIQRFAPGGVLPTNLPSDLSSYLTGPTAAVAATTRQAVYSAETAVRQSTFLQRFWPLLALLAVFLLGLWLLSGRRAAETAFNAEDQMRLASQKAAAALAALKPGFAANDLVNALNFEVINFATGSAQIPADNYEFLNKAAAAMKIAPAGTSIQIGGHTDNSGDAATNMHLSQERADAVRDYLIKQGVDGSMLVAKGFGDSEPTGSNDTDEGRFRNRRIEFSVLR
jgi:outer membrane protein OmpA-like peptidoglycan-associated protein/uncharacterized protein YidB (DUF937 family)